MFDFCPHSIISSLEIHSILLWLTGMVVSVLPLMKLDLEKGVHLFYYPGPNCSSVD